MSELPGHKLSRRKLLGGAAGAAAAIPVLHELVPHQVVHDQLARAAGTGGHEHSGHGGSKGVYNGAHAGSSHSGTIGTVDPKVNGFDPHEIVREFDYGKVSREGGRTVRTWEIVAEDITIQVAPGVEFAAWAYNGRIPGPTLRATE